MIFYPVEDLVLPFFFTNLIHLHMASKLRLFFIFIVCSIFLFLFGLSSSRHIYMGGHLGKKYGLQIESLSEILPNI